MMHDVEVILFVISVMVIVSVVGLSSWYIYDKRTNTLWHPSDCVCHRCLDEALKQKVRRSEWRRRQREMDEAVAEMERAARGQRR